MMLDVVSAWDKTIRNLRDDQGRCSVVPGDKTGRAWG